MWGLINQIPHANAQRLFFVCCNVAGIAILLTPQMGAYTWVIFFTSLFGLTTGGFGVTFPQIVIKIVGLDLFHVGYGYIGTLTGVAYIAGPPIAGEKHFHL